MGCRIAKLGDLCIGGGKYGVAAPAVDFDEDLPAYLRITDINDDGTLNQSDRKSVAVPDAGNYMLHSGDIVFARTGNSTGRNYYYDERDGNFVFAGFLIRFSLDPTKVNPRYVKYFAQSKIYKNWVSSYSTGSTRKNINAKDFASCPILLPNREVQDRIVELLDSVSEKIRVSNRVNDYLEEFCDALFHNFVNGQDGTWHKGTLDELLDIRYGKDHKKLADGPYPVYGSGGYMRSVERPLASGESVLIPRKGTLNNVMYVNEEFWTVDTMFYSVPRKPGAAKYAFQYIKKLDLASMNSGSAVPSMTTKMLNALELPVPSQDALYELDEQLQPMYALASANMAEVKQLSVLRDTLLPKLLSGEVDVSGVLLSE